MKVAYFFVTIESGGAERLILNICNHFKKQYPLVKPHIIVYEKRDNDLHDAFINIGVPVTYLNISEKNFNFKNFLSILNWLKENKPEIVHCHGGAKADKFILLAAFLVGLKKRFCTIHNMDQSRTWRGRLSFKIISFLSRNIIAVSEGAREFYTTNQFFSPDKIKVIYNCAGFEVNISDSQPYKLDKNRTLSIVNVGGLRIQKGQIYLIEAIHLLNKSGLKCRLDIYGGDRFDYGQTIKNKILELGLSNVYLHGDVPDIKSKLMQADIFVAASIREAMPLVVLEALAVGIPIVATDILPHKEVLEPVKNKIIVQSANADALAKGILKLAGDEDLYCQLSKEELVRRLDFTIDATSSRHIDLYSDSN